MDLCEDCYVLHFRSSLAEGSRLVDCGEGSATGSSGDSITCLKERYSSISSGLPPDKELILQPLLTYIAHSLQTGTCDAIKRAVRGHFSQAQVIEAKNTLWDKCDH